MKVDIGDFVHLLSSKAVYQVVKKLKSSTFLGHDTSTYLVRKIFNNRLEYKPEKCIVASIEVFSPVDNETLNKINAILDNDASKKDFVNYLDPSAKYIYKTHQYYLIKSDLIKTIEKDLNTKQDKYINFAEFVNRIDNYQKQNVVIPIAMSGIDTQKDNYTACVILLGTYEDESEYKTNNWYDVKIKKLKQTKNSL